MRRFIYIAWTVALLVVAVAMALPAAAQEHEALVIIFKDGHQQIVSLATERVEFRGSDVTVSGPGRSQTFSVSDIDHIELTADQTAGSSFGRSRFVGRWRVGDGAGGYLYITLNRDGSAERARNQSHFITYSAASKGTWEVIAGQARVSWKDGWKDELRKLGDKYQKAAFEPGRSFTDKPSNVDTAENTSPEPL